jgi:hypothetical protein
MYKDEVPIISGAMRADLECFKRGVMFAILSMRVQFPRVPAQCAELAKKGPEADCLWGHKFDAYQYLCEHDHTLWRAACDANSPEECILALTVIPGLGVIKAGFVAQMLGWDVACLDVRNFQRLGGTDWSRRDRARKEQPAQFRRKVSQYVQETQGRARELWDDWCIDAGEAYLMTAQSVSYMHLHAIVPEHLRGYYEPVKQYQPVPF